MPYLFLILIIALPLLEIYVLIKVGGLIGAIPTIALLVFSAVLGTLLLRWQGFVTLRRVRDALARGESPAGDLRDALLVLISGVLLLIPGFISDIVGLLCLLPPLRRSLTRAASKRRPPGDGPATAKPRPEPHVIEGEFWKEHLRD
jgi:UPF0716 protein FxsA